MIRYLVTLINNIRNTLFSGGYRHISDDKEQNCQIELPKIFHLHTVN